MRSRNTSWHPSGERLRNLAVEPMTYAMHAALSVVARPGGWPFRTVVIA